MVMRKTTDHRKKIIHDYKKDLFGILLGLAIIFLGTGLFILIYFVLTPYIGNKTTLSDQLPLQAFIQGPSSPAWKSLWLTVSIYIIAFFEHAFIYGLSGWSVLIISQHKKWYFAAIPPLIVWISTFIPLHSLNPLFLPFYITIDSTILPPFFQFGYIWYSLFVLCAIAGGLIERHIRVSVK